MSSRKTRDAERPTVPSHAERGNEEKSSLFRWGLRLEWFSLIWNVIEGAVAVTAGIVASSTALIAFGADSSIEVISAAALLWRFKQAGATASAEEHSTAERRALYLVAATFVMLALYITVDSLISLTSQEQAEQSMVGLVLSVLSLIIMPGLAYAKGRVGHALGSKALVAEARETWVCSYLSFTLLAGVGLNYAWQWWWADAVGALAMLPVILWQAWDTFGDARGQCCHE